MTGIRLPICPAQVACLHATAQQRDLLAQEPGQEYTSDASDRHPKVGGSNPPPATIYGFEGLPA
jgi:hypothetical protein